MDEATRTELEAAAFRALVQHLRERTDVQNIDLMELAGFCRNCLSRWYREAAEERGIELEDAEAREIVYGMPYEEWKSRYQAPDPPAERARRARGARAVRRRGRGCGREPEGERDGTDRATEPEEVVLTPEAAREGRAQQRRRRAEAALEGAGRASCAGPARGRGRAASPTDDAPSPGAPTDAEVRAELREARAALTSFKQHLNTTAFLPDRARARGCCATAPRWRPRTRPTWSSA